MSTDGATLPEVEFTFEAGSSHGWQCLHVHHLEGISRLFETSVLVANRTADADPEALFDQKGHLEIRRAGLTRHVHGRVRRVEDLGTTGSYRFARLLLAPELWALSQRTNSRIWQHVPIAQVIRDVLQAAGIYQGGTLDCRPGVDALAPHEYCVQHRETDLAFVQRLLEEEGVPYYFRHDESGEAWVLADEDHPYHPVETLDGGAVPMQDAGTGTSATESAQWFDWHKQLRSTGVTLREFDFTHPSAVLDMTVRGGSGGGARGLYDYPASYTFGAYDEGGHVYRPHHGARFARVRFEEAQRDAETGHGRSNVTGLLAGGAFTLNGHLEGARDRRYVLLEVEHHGVAWGDITDEVRRSEHVRAIFKDIDLDALPPESGEGRGHAEHRYWNKFTVVPSNVKIRPARVTPRPTIPGAQTGTVMAPHGMDEEISTDFHGRILVRFHWERPETRLGDQRSKNASCWIRVAQAWAGAAWGTLFIPRVGMEVVVTFLDGDPDRPLVTGCVYNGENNTPYQLPEEKTKSTIKTSSSPGGQGFNELRFEDLAQNEQIFIHAQRDMDTVIRRNQTHTVGGDRARTVVGNEVVRVQKDRTTSVEMNESHDIMKDFSLAVHGPKGMTTGVDHSWVLTANTSIALTVGDSSIVMTPSKITLKSPTVQVLGDSLVRIKGGLVKINCDEGSADTVEGTATQAAATLALQGEPGGILRRLSSQLDAGKLADQAAKGLGSLLTKLGVPPRITERLTALAKSSVGEMVTALKEGRRPNFSKIAEGAITNAAKSLVGDAFKHIEGLPAVKGSPVLTGLVSEVRGVTTTAVTYGALHAAGLRDGLARDPFMKVLTQRHGESIRNFLTEQGTAAAREVLNGWAENQGLPPVVRQVLRQASAQAEKAIRRIVDQHILPASTQPAASP